ncbi:MAG: selenium-dependent molybdenum cofactor biosynthesis protein YqeB [Rhodocyclaceae bacterium]|nr:selenium-dependent molybdenum cofactor biosynthesis protein YqeB [Rhodocyclaceae bacterium]
MTGKALKERVIVIKGAGEMATGVACRLFGANLRRILMLETDCPLAVRRRVSFCEAVHEGSAVVEGIAATLVSTEEEIFKAWEAGMVAVRVDPQAESVSCLDVDVLIDATLAKRNLGISVADAPLVIALGPGFEAGRDCHVVIETNRGHDLGRLLRSGMAAANTGIPGDIGGYTSERVLRAPVEGQFVTQRRIGDLVNCGDTIGQVGDVPLRASIDGILRGLIRPGSTVKTGLKIGDIDPRKQLRYCDTISEKARAIGGAVLESVLSVYNV